MSFPLSILYNVRNLIHTEFIDLPLKLEQSPFFFFQNNYKSQTILLVSQGFETILVSNKLSAENSILLCEIALGTRVWDSSMVLECETLDLAFSFLLFCNGNCNYCAEQDNDLMSSFSTFILSFLWEKKNSDFIDQFVKHQTLICCSKKPGACSIWTQTSV